MKNSKFMQPLLPTFLTTCSIPESYSRRLEHELNYDQLPLEEVILTTEDQADRKWVVRIEDGRHFRDGWKEFCIENELKVGDFLVFTYQNSLLFCVRVYDSITSCQRGAGSKRGQSKLNIESHANRSKPPEEEAEAEAEAEVAAAHVQDVESQSVSCRVTLTSGYIRSGIVYLPKRLLRLSGLLRKRCEITLVDEKGEAWEMKLSYNRSTEQGFLAHGWQDYLAANNLQPNDSVSFKVIEAGERPTIKALVHKVQQRTRVQYSNRERLVNRSPVKLAEQQKIRTSGV